MQIESLSCNNCGAPLDVGQNASYATCAHCGSRLAIHRTGSAAYTEVLADIKKDTGQILEHTNALLDQNRQLTSEMTRMRLDRELKELDDQWAITKRKWLDSFPRGTSEIPQLTKLKSRRYWWIALLIGCGIVLVWAVSNLSGGFGMAPWEVGAILAAIIAIYNIWGINSSISLVVSFYAAQDRYLRQRSEITEQIDEIDGNY